MSSAPWYRTALRWGQTNLVEIDPARYDAEWWREHWRRTRVQGVIVNAGGIVAYYPSRYPLHHRALTLGDGDLYGEIVALAKSEGIKVVARMDSNRVAEDFYRAHPDWVCLDINGNPYRVEDKFITCINSPYYWEYLPGVLTEIISRSQPDGFADNSWAGIPRSKICYCQHCTAQFREHSGLELPREHNWDNEAYRRWVAWNYQRRIDLWELNNRVSREAGGEDCHWMGMLSGSPLRNSDRFIDLREILARSEIVMLDHQHRSLADGFEQNTETGKRLHELLGWEKLIPESTPQYQLGVPAFRVAAMPVPEVQLWAAAGFAGGIQPWWHHIGSCHDDRRQYTTAEPIFTWHEDNQDILIDRDPVADVGVVWSPNNHDFYGRDRAEELTLTPYRGAINALNDAGIGYLPIHADDIAGAAGRLKVLILPNMAALSDSQIAAVQEFAAQGGSAIATGETSLYTEQGDRRTDFGLADLFGVHAAAGGAGAFDAANADIETYQRHTYLRLSPQLRAEVYGPKDPTAPAAEGERHPVLADFDQTDLLPFGGYLPNVTTDPATEVLATFVPPFPIFPPETSWMRTPQTDLPAVTVREAAGSRLVWLVADLDRCYGRDQLPDHARVIANAVRWAIGDAPSVVVDGNGLVAGSLYAQPGRRILHLTNTVLTSRIPGRQKVVVPVGPVRVRLHDDSGQTPQVTLRVSGRSVAATREGDQVIFEIDQVLDHEVAVIE